MIPLRVQFYWRANWSPRGILSGPCECLGCGLIFPSSCHPTPASSDWLFASRCGEIQPGQAEVPCAEMHCQPSLGHCPLCVALSPVPLVNCFIVSLLQFYYGYCMQSGFLLLSTLPASWGSWKCLLSWVDSSSLS